jgi:hypothetical protein
VTGAASSAWTRTALGSAPTNWLSTVVRVVVREFRSEPSVPPLSAKMSMVTDTPGVAHPAVPNVSAAVRVVSPARVKESAKCWPPWVFEAPVGPVRPVVRGLTSTTNAASARPVPPSAARAASNQTSLMGKTSVPGRTWWAAGSVKGKGV